MSRRRCIPARTKAAFALLLLAFASSVSACDEDGKTAPARCLDPTLPIFDIQAAGAPADDNARYPCVTEVGHATSPTTTPTTDTAGSAGKAATSSAGKGGSGDTVTAGAGAGGAP
jgi:hypothetical protein